MKQASGSPGTFALATGTSLRPQQSQLPIISGSVNHLMGIAAVGSAGAILGDPMSLPDVADFPGHVVLGVEPVGPNPQIGEGVEVPGEAIHLSLVEHLRSPVLTLDNSYEIFGRSSIPHMRNNRMGRKKMWSEDMQARFAEGTLERMESALKEGETKTDFVREAVERELKRRKA
jgi:hypothetical protein